MTRIIRTVALFCAAAMCFCISVQAQTNVDEETPLEVRIACNKYGAEYDICPELLEAICYNESRYLPDVFNGTCRGIMQINEPYHKERMERLGVTDIYDLEGNIHVGADYLAELFAQYEDVGVVLSVYHGESKAVERAKKGNLSKYVKKILAKSEELERLHGK